MSDTMLLGVLRMPIEVEGGPLSPMAQLVERARAAADRIEADAKRIAELEAALAAQGEPAAWMGDGTFISDAVKRTATPVFAARYPTPLYTAPQALTLTDEQIALATGHLCDRALAIRVARAVLAAASRQKP
jgi:hypothetical protein